MTPLAVGVGVMCQLCLVAGQLLLKRAMIATNQVPRRWNRIGGNFAGGIGCLSLWFFLWLGLLRNWDLSRLFPFEGFESFRSRCSPHGCFWANACRRARSPQS